MKYLGYAIIPFVVGVITPLIYSLIEDYNYKKNSKMNSSEFIISNSLILCIIAVSVEISLAIIFVILNLYGLIDILQNTIHIIFLLFFAFGSFLLIREKTIIKNNNIIHIPGLGKAKKFTFRDIKKVIEINTSKGLKSYQIFSDKKMFIISSLNIGTKLFINKVKELNIPIEIVYK